jgi:hypothetical protein
MDIFFANIKYFKQPVLRIRIGQTSFKANVHLSTQIKAQNEPSAILFLQNKKQIDQSDCRTAPLFHLQLHPQ